MTDFLEKLRALNMTYPSLAAKIGCSKSYLSEIGSGKKTPSLKTAFAIQDATRSKITARYLLKISPEGQKETPTKSKPIDNLEKAKT